MATQLQHTHTLAQMYSFPPACLSQDIKFVLVQATLINSDMSTVHCTYSNVACNIHTVRQLTSMERIF